VKLLVFLDSMHHHSGGAERWAASAAQELRTRGVEVTLRRLRRGPWSGEQLKYVLDHGDYIGVTTAEFWSR
jgi:hypothetical protein